MSFGNSFDGERGLYFRTSLHVQNVMRKNTLLNIKCSVIIIYLHTANKTDVEECVLLLKNSVGMLSLGTSIPISRNM